MAQKAIENKMTFYDLVTLIIPSALICMAHKCPNPMCFNGWVGYIAYFGILLMVGLILKMFCAWWGGLWFRNNTDIIKRERMKVSKEGGEHIVCEFLSIFIFDPIRYILSPLSYIMYQEDQEELKKYYEKYDMTCRQEYYSKRIDILESHVAFLQTWTWAIVICIPSNLCTTCCKMLFCYACIVVMQIIQRKIYNMIWEGKGDNTPQS